MVWFLMEGGAIISAVGFLLSGETAPGIVSAVAFVAILLSGTVGGVHQPVTDQTERSPSSGSWNRRRSVYRFHQCA